MRVESKRLYLYPISDDDMRYMIENENDPEMKQAYGEMLQGCLDNPEKRIWNAVWLMELKNRPGVIVGDFCFKGLGRDGMVEIGYGLRTGFCGNGYMTETVNTVTRWALMQEGVTRVEAETDENNEASYKVLKNAGFKPVGIRGAEGPRYVYTTHDIKELPAWERLFKRIVWEQLGNIEGKRILDFGSGEGITANYFAKNNEVIAVEPFEEMLKNRWADNLYTQIIGNIASLSQFEDGEFDVIICHNVLEYVDDKSAVVKELTRVLKPGGMLSIVKHNRTGRVMQMAVLLDDMEKANSLLDGEDSTASKFGTIRYYEDSKIQEWSPKLSPLDSYGIRTFWDLQQNQEKHGDEEWQKKMMQLEMRVSQIDEYRNVAFFHHLIFIK